jgi:hypothetical protein
MLVGWGGHVWTHGYDARDQEEALGHILRLDSRASDEIDRYGVDYVAISQREVDDYDADLGAYQDRYPVVVDDTYTIFAVSPGAIQLALASGSTPPPDPAY